MNPMSVHHDNNLTTNERFLAFLDRKMAPTPPRPWYTTAGIASVVSLLAIIFLILLQYNVHALWPMIPLGVVLIARGGMALKNRLTARKHLSHLRRVVQNGVPVTGYVVQAHASLLQSGQMSLPCTVLFSFQPEVEGETEYMRYLAERLYAYKNQTPDDADGKYLASLVNDDYAVPYRRRKLPYSFTDGSSIYCADLWVKPAYLEGNCLKTNRLPCVAEAGDIGGLELVPYWLLDEVKPLPQADTHSRT